MKLLQLILPQLLYFFLLLSVSAGTFIILERFVVKSKSTYNLLLAFVHAFVCFVTLIFFCDSANGVLSTNKLALQIVAEFDSSHEDIQKGNINGHPLILIDNSENKELIANPSGNAEDSCTIVVTDRRKLSVLLNFLAAHQDSIDQVICDIQFNHPSPHDAQLLAAIGKLSINNKILLPTPANGETSVLNIAQSALAVAQAPKSDGNIVNFELVRDGQYSLPYELYLRANHLHSDHFLGAFSYERGDLGLVYENVTPCYFDITKTDDRTTQLQEYFYSNISTIPLGFAVNPDGFTYILQALRKSTPTKKAIVFIGEFASSQTEGVHNDVHTTLFGDVQGSSILLNIFYGLEHHFHEVKYSVLFLEFTILFLVSFLLILRIKKAHTENKENDEIHNEIRNETSTTSKTFLLDVLKKLNRHHVTHALKSHLSSLRQDLFILTLTITLLSVLYYLVGTIANVTTLFAHYSLLFLLTNSIRSHLSTIQNK